MRANIDLVYEIDIIFDVTFYKEEVTLYYMRHW